MRQPAVMYHLPPTHMGMINASVAAGDGFGVSPANFHWRRRNSSQGRSESEIRGAWSAAAPRLCSQSVISQGPHVGFSFFFFFLNGALRRFKRAQILGILGQTAPFPPSVDGRCSTRCLRPPALIVLIPFHIPEAQGGGRCVCWGRGVLQDTSMNRFVQQ